MTRVAMAQFAPGEDGKQNLHRIEELAMRARAEGAELVVFPEYSSWFSPVFDERFAAAAQALDGDFVIGISAIAKRLGLTVVAGMVEASRDPDDARISNTVIAARPDGAIAAIYRKVHLYDAFGVRESDWFRPGEIEDAQIFQIDGLRFGLQTCYDLRFPEISRRLVDAGAEVIVMPAAWMAGENKVEHWTTLCRARAIENTTYLLASDQVPPVGVGTSLIIDPLGRVLAAAGSEEGVIVADIEPSMIQSVRAVNPAIQLRRFQVTPV